MFDILLNGTTFVNIMIERLQKIIKDKNMTASQFAEALGIQRSGLSHILSGRNQPSLDFIKKLIAQFPDVDLYWLLTGEPKFYEAPKQMPSTPDLFNQGKPSVESPEVKMNKTTESLRETVVHEIPSMKKPEVSPRQEHTFPQKSKVKRVILLYDDGTYEILIPGD